MSTLSSLVKMENISSHLQVRFTTEKTTTSSGGVLKKENF